jgi:hypothetical protein
MKTKKVKWTSYKIKIYFFNWPGKYLNELESHLPASSCNLPAEYILKKPLKQAHLR